KVKFKTGLGYNAASSTAASPAVESFVNSSKMLENQEYSKSKSDKGNNAVPPPYIGNFIPFKPDLTFMDEIVESENMDVITIVTPSNVKKVESNHESADVKNNGDAVEPKTVRKNSFRPPVIDDWNSDNDIEVEFIPNVKDKTVRPSTEKIKFVKSARKTVEKVEPSKQNKHYPRGNQRKWNNIMSQRLGSYFKMINKACFICGNFEHLHNVCDKKVIRPVWNNSSRVNHKNFANKMTHPHPNRRFVPQAVLTRSGKINTAGASVNTAGRPVNTAGSKTNVNHPRPISNAYKKGYSQVTKPFNKYSTNKNSIFNKKVNTVRVKDTTAKDRAVGNPQQKEYKEKGVIDSGCSKHMTGNKCYLTEYEDYDGGFVSFGDGKGRIYGKGKIKTGTLDFDNVYFCKELKYNLFSVSQICDKKSNVLFTDTKCLVLSSDFKLLDESQVLLRVPRKDNIYNIDLKSVVPTKGLTCLFAKATIDESNLWHRRLGHINFKNINKLAKGNLVRGLPSKIFKNNHSCVASQKGKQHKASCKDKLNGVAERRNRTLIEAARTMLVDSKLPTTFWAEAVNTACYVLNRVLVIKPHNKTPYELIRGRTPLIDFMKPFGCPVTILNTRDHLGKFDGKADEGFFVGYSVFPDKVYKVEKALYGLHQAPRAWYETLSTYLIKNGFRRGTIDKTLFIKKDKGDILLVQVYVDDIIFRSTNKSLCDEFEGLMHKRFQMSSMGELTFFLGLQVQQKEDGIFISQDKYVAEILKKFDFATVKTTSTPMEPNKALVKDEEADSVDVHLYRSMIGSLMYLTASRPDITFAVCACARDSPFDLEAFLDSDYAGASLDRKSTTGGCQFLGKRLISWQCKKQTIVANSTTKAEYVAAANCCGQNPVFHSKTKHIEIRHHFIRDSYEKRLIQGRLMVYKCSGLYTSAIWIEVGRIVLPGLLYAVGQNLVLSGIELVLLGKFSTVGLPLEEVLLGTEENADFHQILDFLTSSSINFALTAVVVSESSVRRDLHLNDEDGTACLTTNEIFENLALMGYEPASDKLTFYKGLFSPQWKNLDPKKFLMYPRFCNFFNIQLPNLVIPFNDIHETPKLTKKVFTNMRKPGKGFSGRVTPLFQNMLVPLVVVGEGSEQPPEPQPTPSTAPPEVLSQVTTAAASQPPKDPNTYRRTKRGWNTKVPQSGGSPNKVGDEAINEEMFDSVERVVVPGAKKPWGVCKLRLGLRGVINLSSDLPLSGGHTLGSGFMIRESKDCSSKEIAGLKRRVTKLEQRQRSGILKNHPFRFGSSRRQSLGMAFVHERDTEVIDTKKLVNTAGEGVSTASVFETVSTAAPRTPPTTTTVFDDEDVTMAMAQTLIKMKEEKAKEKGVVIKDVEDSSRPVRSITTLQPLPTIDPKDKGKGILQETESVEKTKKKVQGDAQMERDAEVALRLQAELDEELRVERERQEEASKVAIAKMFDEVQARMDADYELAARMTQEEQEKYTIKERARLLAKFFERIKKQLAAERVESIRNKPPTKTQLRNLMMTYQKNIGGYKHKKEAQKLGKRLKRVTGSYAAQKSPKKPKVMKSGKDVTKEEATEYEKGKKELRLSLKIISDDDSEVDYEPLSRKFPIMN
ncbi:ribonuclease H-like domain-containing protein, partial [Tanacetum coccineum]